MKNHLIHTIIAIFCVTMFAAPTVWADGADDEGADNSKGKQVSSDKKNKEKKK